MLCYHVGCSQTESNINIRALLKIHKQSLFYKEDSNVFTTLNTLRASLLSPLSCKTYSHLISIDEIASLRHFVQCFTLHLYSTFLHSHLAEQLQLWHTTTIILTDRMPRRVFHLFKTFDFEIHFLHIMQSFRFILWDYICAGIYCL